MAKKQRGKKLKTSDKHLENWIILGYKNGVWHSTVFHTMLFLILALVVTETKKVKPIKLRLSFNDTSIIEEISMADITAPAEVITDKEIEHDLEKIPLADSEMTTVDIRNIQPDFIPDENYTNNEPKLSELTKVIRSSNESDKFNTDDSINSENKYTSNDNSNQNIDELIGSFFGNNRNNQSGQGAQNPSDGAGFGDQSGLLGERLQKAGAKTGDIQISIGWDTIDDIDLHVLFKNKFGQSSYICWMSRNGVAGGMLDVDMNAHPSMLTNKPVENIFWPTGNSPSGEYTVGIHNFRNWSGNPATPVIIVIKTKEFTKTIRAVAIFGQNTKEVFKFTTANP